MNESKEVSSAISQELIEKADIKYKDILFHNTVTQLIESIEYEVFENERESILNLTIEEFLRDWSRDGLF